MHTLFKKISKLETIKTNIVIYLILLLNILLFYPSLFTFFTHDDFYHLNISNANNLIDFIKFFDLTHSWSGYGHFRPLTDQFLYFIDIKLFQLNPLPLHILSFMIMFCLIWLVFKLSLEMTKDRKLSYLAAFFYGVSSTHFVRLYFLQGLQELGVALFILLSTYLFINYLKKPKLIKILYVLGSYILAFLSKETAVILPLVFVLVYGLIRKEKKTDINLKKFFISLLPFMVFTLIYLILHIYKYGLAQGDSYIWQFSPKIFNTIFWYFLWTLNIPEMLVDYIGPGLKVNANLFKFYASQIIPILGLFMAFVFIVVYQILIFHKKYQIKDFYLIGFGISWFLVGLLPVVLLPWHKFPLELTIPLFGVMFCIGRILSKSSIKLIITTMILFLITTYLTNSLTYQTHWVIQGASSSKKVLTYISTQELDLTKMTELVFYDTEADKDLPWNPSEQLKTVLGDQHFFKVYFPNITAYYGDPVYKEDKSVIKIPSSQMLGY